MVTFQKLYLIFTYIQMNRGIRIFLAIGSSDYYITSEQEFRDRIKIQPTNIETNETIKSIRFFTLSEEPFQFQLTIARPSILFSLFPEDSSTGERRFLLIANGLNCNNNLQFRRGHGKQHHNIFISNLISLFSFYSEVLPPMSYQPSQPFEIGKHLQAVVTRNLERIFQ